MGSVDKMQTHTVTTYTYDELTSEAKDYAFSEWRQGVDSDPYVPFDDDIRGSIRGGIESAGLTLSDWNIGTNAYSWLKVAGLDDGWTTASELRGKRALAWLENNLLAQYRIPWSGEQRTSVAKYGRFYRPGMVSPCPFTGYYLDDVVIDHLINRISKCDDTLEKAFESLASVWQRASEDEVESARSREYFEDTWAHETQYLANGDVWEAV